MFKEIQNFDKNNHAAPPFDLKLTGIISVEIKDLQLSTVLKMLVLTAYKIIMTHRY